MQFGSKPEGTALLTGKSSNGTLVIPPRIIRNHAKITVTILRPKSGLQSGFSRSAHCKLLLSESFSQTSRQWKALFMRKGFENHIFVSLKLRCILQSTKAPWNKSLFCSLTLHWNRSCQIILVFLSRRKCSRNSDYFRNCCRSNAEKYQSRMCEVWVIKSWIR